MNYNGQSNYDLSLSSDMRHDDERCFMEEYDDEEISLFATEPEEEEEN